MLLAAAWAPAVTTPDRQDAHKQRILAGAEHLASYGPLKSHISARTQCQPCFPASSTISSAFLQVLQMLVVCSAFADSDVCHYSWYSYCSQYRSRFAPLLTLAMKYRVNP